jgi:hypothetical protein
MLSKLTNCISNVQNSKTTNKNQMANINKKSIGIKGQKTKQKTIAKKGRGKPSAV